MKDEPWKWLYTFTVFLAMMAWAVFLVFMAERAIANPTPANIMELTGVGVLLGALITMNQDIKQFWFRKKPDEGTPK